jgi:hypothetical protein
VALGFDLAGFLFLIQTRAKFIPIHTAKEQASIMTGF